ncbi:MAG: putative cyclase [Chloroflexi bacterium]|nr:putative cyclase [Chloroflexota bacterium]
MSAEENKALVTRFFEEFCNGRNLALADTLMTPDHVYQDPQIPNVRGPQAMAQTIAVFQDGVDGHWQVEEMEAAEGDRVVTRWTGTGTHNAEVMGIPPTGKPVRVSALSLHRIVGGKLAEHWCVWDTLGFLQQVGVVPSTAQEGGKAGAPQEEKQGASKASIPGS